MNSAPKLSDTDIVNQWLSQLQPELRLNELGYCSLADEDVVLVAEVPGTTEHCHVFGVVMPAPEAAYFPLWLQEAMRLNLMGRPLLGCWLAYDPEESALFLCHNLRIDRTSADDFETMVNTMVALIKTLREQLTPEEATLDELREDEELARE